MNSTESDFFHRRFLLEKSQMNSCVTIEPLKRELPVAVDPAFSSKLVG
jgi:hypothetical protein